MRSCSIHGGHRNCFRCFGCNSWYCEDECDLVHTCYDCGGTYCLHCRKCLNCADLTRIGMATRSHDDSRLCECGSYLDLVGMVCVGCNRLCCLGKCERELVTNYCCGLDKCWRCSLWFCQLPRCVANTGARRVCATCPHPPDAVLRRRIFPTAGGGE